MNDPINQNTSRMNSEASALADRVSVTVAPVMAVEDRSAFIVKTYMHLLGAIAAFVGIEAWLFSTDLAERITQALVGGRSSWLLVLGAFMIVSWIATHFAHSPASILTQYIGLAIYVVAEAIIFVPMLFIAERYAPGAIQSAALCTLLGFGGLTLVAWGTRKDFSFLRGILFWSMACAFVAIIASVAFGFTLGMLFSVLMVALAGGAVLYDTSNVIHHYPANRYVGAALQLFASIALMMWYILRIFMNARR